MSSDLRHLLPLLVMGGTFAFVGAVLYGTWLLGRYHGREEELPGELAHVEARLQRLELAMSKTTNALERLEAAHRLTARMLDEEAPSRMLRLPGRQVTPH